MNAKTISMDYQTTHVLLEPDVLIRTSGGTPIPAHSTILRKEIWRRRREEEKVYAELSEAMQCLEHICTEGCTHVGPYHVKMRKDNSKPCSRSSTCQGLQLLIHHFGRCKRRMNAGCLRCKQMWHLFKLHSFICQQTHSCNVPLCRQIQLRIQHEKRKDDPRWKLLARKVASAKVMSSLSPPKRKRDEENESDNEQSWDLKF